MTFHLRLCTPDKTFFDAETDGIVCPGLNGYFGVLARHLPLISGLGTGVLKVREYLSYIQTRPIDNINKPKLYVNPHCLNTIKAFQYWSLDDKGKYQDAYKDPMDVIRYLVMAKPHQSEPIPYMEPRKRYG